MDRGSVGKMVKITRIVLGMLFLPGLLFSEENLKKRTILSSMKESYLQLPKENSVKYL